MEVVMEFSSFLQAPVLVAVVLVSVLGVIPLVRVWPRRAELRFALFEPSG